MLLKNLFRGQQWRNRHREQTYRHGQRGERVRKSNMETYTTICEIDSQREFAVWLRKLQQRLCSNIEGERGGRREGGSKGRDICVPMADSC